MTRSRTRTAVLGGALTALALVLLPASLAGAEEVAPDGQTQVLDPNQAQGTGQVVLDDGHIDFGPTLTTGEWIIQIHDDTSSPSYWRNLEDVVAQVSDLSTLTIPDSDAYAFLELAPGSEAWVIPQVREPGVIWAGWNTQEPTVLDNLNMGTTLRILGVEGPGDVSVFLQSGNFGEPEPLWSTHAPFPQDSWIALNTHTHANWVFSEPGIYLVEMEFSGELLDGSPVVAQDTLRFAVGDATDPQAAFGVEIDPAVVAARDADAPAPDGAPAEVRASEEADTGMGLIVGIVAVVVGAALVVALVVVIAARVGARKRARRCAWERARAEAPLEPHEAASPDSVDNSNGEEAR